jgi:murein DD-endopeptidase MepM/ murein hydrolase activator NlpD
MALSRDRRQLLVRSARPDTKPARRLPWLLSIFCAGWSIAATGLAITQHLMLGRQADEAVLRQVEYDEKVRALTRRLVGVASYQMLEQDGLTERMTDIITRQVELENREAALAASLERALAGDAVVRTRQPVRSEEPVQHPPLRKGSASDPAFARKSLREQFDQIESGLKQVERRQIQLLDRFSAVARGQIERVRAVLADLQIAIKPEPMVSAPPAPPDTRRTFSHTLAGAEAFLVEAVRWRKLAESVPLRSPIDGETSYTSNFGFRSDPFTGERRMHAGMDFRSAVGTIVRTTASGRVVVAGQSGGYGTLVEVDHGYDLITRYAHLSSTNVEVGQMISAGTVVGIVGSTGRSTGPHLHYETRLSGTPLDPARFITAGQKLSGASEGASPATDREVPETAD